MSDIKTCVNGHQYDAEKYSACPFCPKSSSSDATCKTKISDAMKTSVVGGKNNAGSEKTNIVSHPFSDENKTVALNRTCILPGEESARERKLVGFLVSYDLHCQGKLFKLFEGKNLVGSERGCDIVIENVSAVSGKHLTILYRNNSFLFKDEFSTNGTYIDGIMRNEGELNKECVITIGGVRMYFIMVPFHLIHD